MAERQTRTTILVPFDASDPGNPSPGLIELLTPHRIIVLGYYPVPDQASTKQVRDQYGDTANEATDEMAARFAKEGGEVESVVVFTHDRSQSIDRISAEKDVDAVLTEGLIGDQLDRILVPLRGDGNLDRIVSLLEQLLGESTATATLFNVPEDDTRGEFLLRGARDRLTEDGIDPDRIDWRQERSGSPSDAIVEATEEYDLTVVGETEPSLSERLLGDVTNEVITGSSGPVLVVRND